MRSAARFAIAALAAALLLAACSDQVPAPATPTPEPTASPAPTRRPTLSPTPQYPPELLTGIEIAHLVVQVPIELPPDMALIIETGCWQCDGPTTGFARVYRDAGGGVRTETLLAVGSLGLPPHEGEFSEHYITGFAARDDGSEIIVSVCTAGYCGGLGYPTPDAREALYRSTDGGVSWQRMAETERSGWVTGIVAPGAVLMSEYREEGARYYIFPGDEPVKPPVTGAWPRVLETGEVVWNTESGAVLRSDGAVVFGAKAGDTALSVGGPEVAPNGTLYVYVTPFEQEAPRPNYMVELDTGGRPELAYQLPEYPAVGAWNSATSFLGNVFVPADRILPSPSPTFSPNVPAMFDLAQGRVLPIPDAIVSPYGRNRVVAFQTGPFARVVNTGSCLNIRDAPNESGVVLECVRDGVLLQHENSVAIGDPRWAWVRAPSGTEGWAAVQYVER